MKRIMTTVFCLFFAVPMVSLLANDVTVKELKGTVEIRRGISEEWKALQAGEMLRPEDTIRTGKNASVRVLVDGKQLRVPENTMVDISDFRHMGQEEFLLKLAMENILAVPPREDGSLTIPRTTVIHGTDARESSNEQLGTGAGLMQLQGAKLLYENSFHATSILKAKETFRLYPDLQTNIDARMRIATSFETMKLSNEALTEYSGLLGEQLPDLQKRAVQKAIERIRSAQR